MRPRWLAAIAAIVIAVTGALTLATPAAADQVWHQSVGRASADAACPADSAADTSAGWSPWTPSWERWANAGTGGFVCSRAITWAYEGGDAPFPGCQQKSADTWMNFGWSRVLAGDMPLYDDSGCTQRSVQFELWPYVYATTADEARDLCQLVSPWSDPTKRETDVNPDIWRCVFVP